MNNPKMDLMGKYVDLNISKMINNLIIGNFMYIYVAGRHMLPHRKPEELIYGNSIAVKSVFIIYKLLGYHRDVLLT